MSYDAIVVGAGISGAATAYHLRKAGAKTLLIERGEPASGGTGKSAAIIRQSYSTPLLVRLARASITMFENARAELGKDAGFVQAGYCFVLPQDMLEGAKKNVAMQKGLGIANEWCDGPGFPQHLPEINPDGIAGIVYEPDSVDSQNDYATAHEIRKAAHRYMMESGRFKVMHKDAVEGVRMLETYIAPVNFRMGDQMIRKGSWVIVLKVLDADLWKQVKEGKITGFSMGGRARASA